ncbi:MAG: adenylate/guanylate cyclase domain-containing protein, partial [Nocardioides sp.]
MSNDTVVLGCPGCGHESAAKFCPECGTALRAPCPACGTAAAGGQFCGECGSALSAPAARPAAVAPVAERRLTSLLFADLAGFTPLAESRDPEAVRELLSAYFLRARAVVERYGGTVEKFIGDAVFAVWGVPSAREDDAVLAVRAGLDLVSAVHALGEELGVEGLVLRVGITTGQVAVSLGAVGEGMVAGDAVNTAARVQSTATPGQVWVDDTTRSLSMASVAFEATGSHVLKGKSLPAELFRALRTTAEVGGEQRVDGLEAPFVGRDRELRLVKELFHATGDEGRPRLVLVVGEPGIGKSRLAWEFEKYVDAIPSTTTWWLRGRCLSYGSGIAGWVVADMFRSLLRVTADEGDDAVRQSLENRLEQVVADPAERAVLRPRLLSLLGVEDSTFEQGDLFACWRGFVEALTRNGSQVTVLVEDLQWADDGSLEFLEHLLTAAASPVMVLALARPEMSERRAGLGSGRRSTTVFLDPLPDPAMGVLVDGLVDGLPGQLRTGLVSRAEGVPLYAVETVRSLVDQDIVVASNGRYVVDVAKAAALDLENLEPPTSLAALMGARLDALTSAERRVVQDASVLGLTFTRTGMEALDSGVDLDNVLRGLCRREIFTVDTDPRSSERGQYRFVQALLRGVAHDTLSRRDRHARHLAAAAHLATLPDGDALAALIATHLLDALAALPDDPGANALQARAAALLEQAAQHAAETGAPSEAVRHYETLLELSSDDATALRVLSLVSRLLYQLGDAQQSHDHAQRGMDLAERLGSPGHDVRLWRAQTLLEGAQRLEGQSTVDVVAELWDILAATEHDPERADLAGRAARNLVIGRQDGIVTLAEAERAALRGLAAVERHGSDDDVDLMLDTMTTWAQVSGYRRFGGFLNRASIERAVTPTRDSFLRLTNGAVTLLPDDPRSAADLADRSLALSGRLGLPDPGSRSIATYARLLAGQLDETRAYLAEMVDGAVWSFWSTYQDFSQALVAWATSDGSLLPPEGSAEQFGLTGAYADSAEAIRAALGGRLHEAVELSVRSIDAHGRLSPLGEDLPVAWLVTVDLLLALGDMDTLERVTAELEQIPTGQRYHLLHGQLLRARAHLSEDPAPGLRNAAGVLDAMGAAWPAAAV